MHKVLLVGAGAICPTHIAAFEGLDGRAQVVGIVANHLTSAQKAIATAGLDAVAYTDYKQAIEASGCDIVAVLTPPETHREITVWALEHGCHLLLEKPMAPSLEECDAMIEAAARTGNKLQVVAQSRCLTPIWRTKQLLQSGVAGRLLYTQINSFWWRGAAATTWPGGAAGPPRAAAAPLCTRYTTSTCWPDGRYAHRGGGHAGQRGAHQQRGGGPLDGDAALRRRQLCPAFGESCLPRAEAGPDLCVRKSHAGDPHAFSADTPLENGFPQQNTALLAQLNAAYEAIPPLRYEGHAGLADNLLRAIDEGAPLLIDGQQGRNTLELIMAIYQSAAEHRAVTLPITPESPFYTRAGVAEKMPHFYQKTGFLSKFEHDTIVLASANMK